ncbi:MAG TPA: hypothetical protein VFT71_01680 [Candidatus Nitrosocosmicus sp.]|nr:hypothetical protein [Candidatus Nitrosocosmicus sp.]
MRSKLMQSYFIIGILTVSVVSLFTMTVLYHGGSDAGATKSAAFAQLTNDSIIQMVSTSTHLDDFGNFHIIGEVNNTSPDPQTNVLVTALMSDTNNNVLVGNYSAFSSISTLRQGELSPFDIVIQDPQQILGKFNFMEFSTTSEPVIEKPANLLLNGTSVFLDNIGNPHITGNIVNQGPSTEQFLNLVATFYDNSSLGVIGTQSFGLSLGNLSQNQGVPFDVTISDNKTKSQGMFYSLNMDSPQSSMVFPTNTKFFFNNDGSGGLVADTGFVDGGGSLITTPPPISDNQGFVNGGNTGQSFPSGPDNGNSAPSSPSSPSSSTTPELGIEIDVEDDPLVRGNIQTIDVIVIDENTQEKIANATTDLRVFYTTEFDKAESGLTNNDGVAKFEIEIGPASTPGNFDVTATVNAAGYNTETDRTTFEVIEEPDNNNDTGNQNNATNTNNNNEPDTNNNNEEGTNQNEDADPEPASEQDQQQPDAEDQNDTGNGNNEGDFGEDSSSDDNNNNDDDGSNE